MTDTKKYKYIASSTNLTYLFGPDPLQARGSYPAIPTGNVIYNTLLHCCGLVGFSHFNRHAFYSFHDEACFVKGLHENLHHVGHILYAITNMQAGEYSPFAAIPAAVVPEHKVFLNIGAKKIAEFPNLNHGPHKIGLWLVNIRDAVGVYLDKETLEPYKTPPKPTEEIKPEEKLKKAVIRKNKIIKQDKTEEF